jgi:hypothetical protein
MAGQDKKKDSNEPAAGKKPFLVEFEDIPHLTPDKTKELVEEVRIHQVEMEAQVEELQSVQKELQRSRDKYGEA